MSRLCVDRVAVTYDSFSLNDVSFKIEPGEIVALMGKTAQAKPPSSTPSRG